MQSTGILVVLCLVCTVVGGVLVLLVDTREAAPSDPDSQESLAEAVADLSRQVAALERSIAERDAGPTLAGRVRPAPMEEDAESEPTPDDPPKPVSRNRQVGEFVPSDGMNIRRSADDPPVPPKIQQRVDDIDGKWLEDEERRARWTFASEASVLAWFGLPNRISSFDSGERWQYDRIVQGRRAPLFVYFARGRVVRMEP